jgi:hypothetical protein
MFDNSNLPRVVRVKSTAPVGDELEVFDMMSRFLASEKAKQLSHDFAGQAYLASSSQTWNDLRLACNSLLEHNDPRREPVAAWKEQVGETPGLDDSSPETPLSVKEEPANDSAIVKTEDISMDDALKSEKSAKKSAKKAKKEAKKEKKTAKKSAKKEKKRKREVEA